MSYFDIDNWTCLVLKYNYMWLHFRGQLNLMEEQLFRKPLQTVSILKIYTQMGHEEFGISTQKNLSLNDRHAGDS